MKTYEEIQNAILEATKESGLVSHAKEELSKIEGDGDKDDMQSSMNKSLICLVGLFSMEGHSGFSAGYARNSLVKLLDFKPITPLTGEDSEWNDSTDDSFQNKRNSSVFKNKKTGEVYDIDAVRVESKMDGWGTHVRFPLKFPYTPKATKRFRTEAEAQKYIEQINK